MNKTDSYLQVFDDKNISKRLLLTVCFGALVAGFLTWFMYILIQFSEHRVDESARVHILDIVRVKREESSQNKERRVERPEVTKAPPAPATPDFDYSQSDMDSIAVSDIPMDTGAGIDVNGFGVGTGEGEYLPIVKIAPIYPMSAANRGIEGECMVQYTVTATGATQDISVVKERCTHSAFRRPSKAAAKRFKYKPRVVNGEAISVRGVRNLFIFEMEKKESNE